MKKKRFLSLLTALVLIIGTFSINVSAAPAQSEVNSEIKATAEYLATQLDGNMDLTAYPYVFLVAASGIECDSIKQQFLSIVKDNISANKKLVNKDGYEAPDFYGGIIMTLKACGIDPAGITTTDSGNLLSDFETCLSSYDFTNYSGGMWELIYLMSTLQYYADDIEHSGDYIDAVKDAILKYYCDEKYEGGDYVYDPENPDADQWGYVYKQVTVEGTGFYYYGFSPDNNGKMLGILKSFYDAGDTTVKPVVDKLLPILEKSLDANNQVDSGWGINSDSTALVLSALSAYDSPKASDAYTGLLGFKHSSISGAYFWKPANTDTNLTATRDALEALISYERMLSGKASIYDLSVLDQVTINNSSNITVENPSVLPAGATLNIEPITNVPANISESLNKISTSFIAFDFSLLLHGTKIQPDTPLTFSIAVPDGYTNPAIYYVDENGNYQKIDSTVSNGKITFTVTHFSTYAIVNEKIVAAATGTTVPATLDSSDLLLYGILILASLSTFIIIRKKVVF